MAYEPVDLYNEAYHSIVRARMEYFQVALDEGYLPEEIFKADIIYAQCANILRVSYMQLEVFEEVE